MFLVKCIHSKEDRQTMRQRARDTDTERELVFYAQSTTAVISGRETDRHTDRQTDRQRRRRRKKIQFKALLRCYGYNLSPSLTFPKL